MTNSNGQTFIDRLNQHPKLRERVESLLNVVENVAGDCTKADDAEQHVIEALRKMGNDALHCWGDNAAIKSSEELDKEHPAVHRNGKKKIFWHSTFGEIEVIEPIFRRPGKQLRPFSESAGLTARCCSIPLQRAMTDFGADHAFGQVSSKLQEHYGIQMPVSTIRKITEFHGQQIHEKRKASPLPSGQGCEQQIAEIDGCMLPIITVREDVGDKRKKKTLHWKEARLALVHEQGSVVPNFDATFATSVDDAGQSLLNCAVSAGLGINTQIHGVGDGALWIENQMKEKFGSQGSYLIDFYHVCEYLAEASSHCSANDDEWMNIQKKRLKNNQHTLVIESLEPYIEATDVVNTKAPVHACHRYLSNRTNQLNYKDAIEKGLPIGSGEIESAHRYVIQKRLKLSGAWWKAENVEPMLALRIIRANEEWNDYWKNSAKAA